MDLYNLYYFLQAFNKVNWQSDILDYQYVPIAQSLIPCLLVYAIKTAYFHTNYW